MLEHDSQGNEVQAMRYLQESSPGRGAYGHKGCASGGPGVGGGSTVIGTTGRGTWQERTKWEIIQSCGHEGT